MGNYEQLKSIITNVIKANHNQDITGDVLQNVLVSIVRNVGAGATFAGIAVPTTQPASPDQNVYYIAATNGTYGGFGGITITNEVAVLANKSGSWVKIATDIASKSFVQASADVHELTLAQLDALKTIAAINREFGNGYGGEGWLLQGDARVGHFVVHIDSSSRQGFVQYIISNYTLDANGVLTGATLATTNMPQTHIYERKVIGLTGANAWSDWRSISQFSECAGIAEPTTQPVKGYNVHYFATANGTYTNFGVSVSNETAIIYTEDYGTTWKKWSITNKWYRQSSAVGGSRDNINSDGNVTSSKCAVSTGGSMFEQPTSGTDKGKLMMRLSVWGDNNTYKSLEVPTANNDSAGAMSANDKAKLDNLAGVVIDLSRYPTVMQDDTHFTITMPESQLAQMLGVSLSGTTLAKALFAQRVKYSQIRAYVATNIETSKLTSIVTLGTQYLFVNASSTQPDDVSICGTLCVMGAIINLSIVTV